MVNKSSILNLVRVLWAIAALALPAAASALPYYDDPIGDAFFQGDIDRASVTYSDTDLHVSVEFVPESVQDLPLRVLLNLDLDHDPDSPDPPSLNPGDAALIFDASTNLVRLVSSTLVPQVFSASFADGVLAYAIPLSAISDDGDLFFRLISIRPFDDGSEAGYTSDFLGTPDRETVPFRSLPIPEPSSLLLTMLGLLSMPYLARRSSAIAGAGRSLR